MKCADCSTEFSHSAEVAALSQKLRVPSPTLCPDCSSRRRLAFLDYTSLYRRACIAPGHTEELISQIPPEATVPVYDFAYWNSFAWNPMGYGEDVGGGSFRDQFLKFLAKIPQPAVTRHAGSARSEYTLYGYQLNDCYCTFGGMKSDRVHYSAWPAECRDSLDLLLVQNAERSYESVYSNNLYQCSFAYFSEGCVDSDFLYDCRNCTNCFGGVNLRNRQNVFLNEQLSKEEYRKRRAAVNLGNRAELYMWSEKFWSLARSLPVRAVRIEKSTNVSGNLIKNSKNCRGVIRCLDSENTHGSEFVIGVRDSMRVSVASNGEDLYETAAVAGGSSRVKFSFNCRASREAEFIVNCRNVSHCFGCVGLENKEYCILNRQYAPAEYEKKVGEIMAAMLAAGEYGEFFPLSASPFAYNGSLAQIRFPLAKEGAVARGALWHDEGVQEIGGLKVLSLGDVPADIKNVGDKILTKAIRPESGRAFRLIKSELDFYRARGLPIPARHFYDRMVARFGLVNNLRVEPAVCANCGAATLSMYPPNSGWRIFCDACYMREVL